MTADKPKRRWFPFWKLPVMPLCPVHKCPCVAKGTINTASGNRYQRRYCPVAGCKHSVKTTIPTE